MTNVELKAKELGYTVEQYNYYVELLQVKELELDEEYGEDFDAWGQEWDNFLNSDINLKIVSQTTGV